MQLNCNNKLCEYNDSDKLLCGATTVYYIDRRCFTFKRNEDNYKELMQVSNPNYHKDGDGKYKSNRITLVK